MAYKPKNLAKFRDMAADGPRGSAIGSASGMVPGATGGDDRDSQPKGMPFYNDGQTRRVEEGTFSLMQNDRGNPRAKENFGSASYNYGRPTL